REATRKGNRSGGPRRQGVGGLQRRVDVGERGNARTRPSTGGPCRWDLQKSTMPNALTWESMSPERVKVVETCSHESHRRKSRMREIRSSGSGEGPGRVTARPTLQRPFYPAPPEAHPWSPAAPPARRGHPPERAPPHDGARPSAAW